MQYVEQLEILAEFRGIAIENDRQDKVERNEILNRGVKHLMFRRGDMILEKNETRKDSLVPKFKVPYLVLDVRRTSVKIRKGSKEKWIHASRCKQCRESGDTVSDGNAVNNGDVNSEPQNEDARMTGV